MDWLNQENMDLVAFVMLGGVTLLSALGVVFLRNLFHNALFLAACLVSVGGIFLLLGAEFVFAIQLLIYAGAVVVLILFAVMLTQGIRREEPRAPILERLLALAVAAGTAGGLAFVGVFSGLPQSPTPPVAPEQATAALADSLLTQYVVPFEIVSVLLLVAMVGAILIAKPEPKPPAGGEE